MARTRDRRADGESIRIKRLTIFRSLFVARRDAHAVARGDQITARRKPLDDYVLSAHLAGEYRVATYLVAPDATTPFCVIDVDVPSRRLVRRIIRRLRERGVKAYVERSKRKGFHLWIFFTKPVRAAKARALARLVLRGLANPKVEIFPKQHKVGHNRLGNCISLPLFAPDWAKGRTVFLDEHFKPVRDQWSYLQNMKRTDRKAVLRASREFNQIRETITEQSRESFRRLGEPIREGERNKTLTSLAGAMRRHGAAKGAILAALQEHNRERCDPPLRESELRDIASSVSKYPPRESEEVRKDSQATKFVASLGQSDVTLFHTGENEPYITIGIGGHRETHRLRDQHIRRWLARSFFKRTGDAPTSNVLTDVLNLLEALALFEGPKQDVFLRVAQRKRAIYVDLGDKSWRAIKVTPRGWKVVSHPPVNFRRPRGMKSLPNPARGGSIAELRPFLNVAGGNDFVLFVSWLVAALNARGPYPGLVVQGEAGSAKSTAVRVAREMVDPNTTPLRAEPREVRDLMIAARNSWVTAFDNVTHLTPWLSDALCRLATGGGFSTRMLYTDDEEKLFDAMRPTLMNGIDGTVTRGDLLDRSLVLYLPSISDQQRKPEKEFWRQFRRAQPRILGALLDAISCALRRLKNIKLERLPRMADFARWVTAAEPALEWADGTFMRAYDTNRASARTLSLEASLIARPLRMLCAKRGFWQGTATQLLAALGKYAEEEAKQRSWPKTAWALSIELRRIAPNLRATGVDVHLGEKTAGSGSRRLITMERVAVPEQALVAERKEPQTIRRFPRLPIRRFPRG